jgi:hypothetical protein
MFAKLNFKFFCDVNLLISLSFFCPCPCINQVCTKNRFICLQLCCCHKYLLGLVLLSLCGSGTKYVYDIFKDSQGLIACNHSNLHLKWKTSSLDFNTPSG